MTRAWRLYVASWPVFSGAVAILFASWVVLEVAVAAVQRFGILPWAVLHLAFLLTFAGLVAGLHRLALEAVDGRVPRLNDLFGVMGRGPGLLLAFIAYLVVVAIGLVLLVVPGLYAAVRLGLLGQVAAADRLSPAATLREAARLTRGRWWESARILAAVIVVNLLGAALVGVGEVVALPISVIMATSFYRSICPAPVSKASRS